MPLARRILLSLIATLVVISPSAARAAETEMVGVLAVAIEPDVAKQLNLSDEQRAQLVDLIDQRELEGFSQAMKLAKKPREERVAAFADFRAQSEQLGMAILDEAQATKLREIAEGKDDAALEPPQAGAKVAEDPSAELPQAVEAVPPDSVGASEVSQPVAPQNDESASQAKPSSDGKVTFNFQQQPWSEVLRWFAEAADLSLVVDTPPPGTLNYRDDRRYSPAEALDVLNGVLLTKGYTLVRKDRMLLVIDLEQDIIPPNVVTDVPLSQIDQRGEYELVRVLIELGEVDVTAAADSLQRLVGPQGTIVVLPEAEMLQVTETAGRIRTMLSVLEAMRNVAEPRAQVEPELRSYPTGGADAQTMLSVLQTLLEGSPTARLAVDDQTASLIALATPTEHNSIQQTLDKLRTDGRRVELIPVNSVDPMVAATLIDRLFSPQGAADEKKRDPNAPVVEADRYTESLLVRGTAAQVEQIKVLVSQLDTPEATAEPGAGGTIRTLPLAGAELERALEQVENLWPSLRDNPLKMSMPSGGIPSFRPGAEVEREQEEGADPMNRLDEEPTKPSTKTTAAPRRSLFRFANQPAEEESTEATTSGFDPIYISPGVGSTVIASRDVEALDMLERLLATVTEASATGDQQYAVFYLKFSEATTAAALLNTIFGGESAGGGSLMGDLAGAAVGGEGGDLLGSLLGGGGASDSVGFTTGSIDIVPDVRLNALYVRAAAADLQTVNQLLRVIDQPRGPDRIESTGVARLIPLENTSASDVAAVIREVFADRLGGGAGGEPSPRDLLKALQGSSDAADDQEPEQMTLSIDERSNSLVVRSSEPLFEQVRTLVESLDRAGVERPVATRVVALRNTGSNALRETLVSLLGDKALVGEGAGTAEEPNNAAATNSNANAADEQRKRTEQRLEGLRRMQQAMERFGRQQGGGGGGGRGGGRGGRGGR